MPQIFWQRMGFIHVMDLKDTPIIHRGDPVCELLLTWK